MASGNVDIERSRFSDNSYDGASPVGELLYTTGGAINALGELRIVESEFIGNAGSFGGAVHSGSSNLVEITGTTFADNSASTIGGALHAEGSVTIRNSTVTGNTAASSGGINAVGSMTIDFCTIVDNVSELSGAAVSAAGAVTITASILYENPYLLGSNPPAFSDVVTEGALVIDTSLLTSEISMMQLVSSFVLDDSNIVGRDPDLRSLGDHGGFDLPGSGRISTRPPNQGSPAIDTVSLISVKTGADLTDQRGSGYPRDVGGLADMGAVEYRPTPSTDYRFTAPEIPIELPATR